MAVNVERVDVDGTGGASGPGSGRSNFEGIVQIPANITGKWTLTALRADDRTGNVSQWGESALSAMGLAVTIESFLNGN